MTLLNIIFKKPRAQIGGVTIDASINENHVHVAEPTRNPIENGAKVTDHVDIEPFRLAMDCIVSDTPIDFGILNAAAGIAATASNLISGGTRSTDAWAELVKLLNDRKPFTVVTGLKVYENMVLAVLDLNRNAQTGHAINFHAEMEQIRIVGDDEILDGTLADTAKNIGAKTRNLGQRVLDQIDEIAENKLFQGGSRLFGLMQAVFR
ncbi:MAG TPA: hypothetical protein VFW62_11680 [bacterium]|nr:hypothetical protein [bacterium]